LTTEVGPDSSTRVDQSIDEVDVAVRALDFLSDGNRLRILKLLAQREAYVAELTDQLEIPQSLLSYHLRRLREMGIVRPRRKAQRVYYAIDPEAWESFTRPIRNVCEILESVAEEVDTASD
jgi:ArsR family transcriptional regulator